MTHLGEGHSKVFGSDALEKYMSENLCAEFSHQSQHLFTETLQYTMMQKHIHEYILLDCSSENNLALTMEYQFIPS